MLRYFKLSIAQLLCLTAIAGSIVFLATFDQEPLWRNDVLRYDVPTVPRSFELITDKPADIDVSWGDTIAIYEFENGRSLYLDSYRHGWEQIRWLFYANQEWLADSESFDSFDEYDYAKLSFRNKYEMYFLARWEGSKRCREQLEELLATKPEDEIRSRLAYPNFWAYSVPLLVIGLAITLLLANRSNSN